MKPFKVFSKQLFGTRYEHITKSLFTCLILFLALYATKLKVTIAPFILFLTATLFSLGVMWQSLASAHNAEMMMGLFMLPFDNRKFIISYLLAFGSYTLITKALFVLTLFLTVGTWSIAEVLIAVLSACNGCVLAATWYSMIIRKHRIFVVLWGFGIILSIFFVMQLSVFCLIILISLLLAVLYLLSMDAYTFYQPLATQKLIIRMNGKGNVLLYLLRYLTSNKNYLINTAGLWAIACFLPFLFREFDGLNSMPLGFAILCFNTPLCILLSCDPGLEQAIRTLPGQAIRFGSWYCIFIAIVNLTANSIYLISWQLQNHNVGSLDIITAILYALQSAILSVLLEWLYPIRNWKIENDLWHHPRKYIVPIFMMLIAIFVGTWPLGTWIWLCIMLLECFVLLLLARKI